MGLLSWVIALMAISAAGAAYTNRQVTLGPTAVAYIHLLALALFVGVGDWVNFVQGIVSFRTLPKTQFGLLQSRLLPYFFQVLTLSLAAGLVTATKVGSVGLVHVLSVALVLTLANLLFLEPYTTAIMFQRHRLEKEAASAEEAAKLPKHKALSKKFGMYHGLSALASLGLPCVEDAWSYISRPAAGGAKP
ncbi:hypothetical protein WJX72_010499 [[Myrmecia] bisecta]|uniref:TMEM205-like domain-containing protein n=1 Tax=[Myrmecia] bisecta TaxID=41462 RepID=A0AAW1QB68_9CHLO